MELTLLHVDPDCAVCIKPPGVESQRQMPALLTQRLSGPFYAVHRLDRETGGVMVYARTARAAAELSRQMAEHTAHKRYFAVAAGCPEPPEGTWEDWLFHDRARNKSYLVNRPRRGVKKAQLSYRVCRRAQMEGRTVCLVAVTLHTGRTHQIRAQFAGRGLPLLGDRKYGGPKRAGGLALWAGGLTLTLRSGERQTFFAPPPWQDLPLPLENEVFS